MNNKTLTLLGFASKAGKLSYGMQKSCEALKNNKTRIIVCAEDISQKTLKEITFFACNKNVKTVTLNVTVDDLSAAVGRKCGVISVNDDGFAQAIFNQEAKIDAND